MFRIRKKLIVISAVIVAVGVGVFSTTASAAADQNPPRKKRIDGEPAKRHKARVAPVDTRRGERVRPRKTYVKPRGDYRHVRVVNRNRRQDGRLNARPIIVRSARVTPVVLDRFEDRRREQIRLMIRNLREGQRARAIELWGGFVSGLIDYREPIDLDDVMMYIAREGCVHEDSTFSYHALKLEFLRESEELAEDYIEQLYGRREACTRRASSCSARMIQDVESELIRTRAKRDILNIESRVASDEFEANPRSSNDYEHQFATVFEDMYREVEVRIRFSP